MTPTLIHVGYHKTATKWLRDTLFRNSEAGFQWIGKWPETSALNKLIFDRPLDFDAAAVRAEFEPLFAKARAADLLPVVCFGRLSGHGFSGGYDSKLIADRLKEVIPEARILIVIREQRSMIVSTYKQYVKAGGVCTLDYFLEPAKAQGWRVPSFDYRHFEYDRLIAHYQQLYGNEAVLVLPYEQLVDDPRAFIAAVARFAGKTPGDDILDGMAATRRRNRAEPALTVTLARPLNRFGPRSDLNPAPMLHADRLFRLAGAVLKRVDPLSTPGLRKLGARSEEHLREAVGEAVGTRYVQSNRATAQLIGLDLETYGWMV